MSFQNFSLHASILKSLEKIGYLEPTPIQKAAIPSLLEKRDLLAIAQTGTGKTAAFCLPIINNIIKDQPRTSSGFTKTLILTPTRELALQIHANLVEYGENLNQKYAVIFGGVSQGSQVKDLQKGPHVLVATPGRLLDLIEQRFLNLSQVETFVLDEADRMLDMGFFNDIKKIIKMLPKKRHSLFFSATMPKEIEILANEILTDPKKIEVTPESTTVERIAQSVMYVDKPRKADLLIHLLKNKNFKKTLIFVEMKHVANRITETLIKNGISAAAIHGNKSQSARQKALQDFKDGKVRILVATDIASRGIDVDGITHVINYELSNIIESYVHRVGRTARAGKDGEAVSLVTADEKSYLVDIERSTNQKIPVDKNHPYHSEVAENAAVMSVGKAKSKIEAERKAGLKGTRFARPERSGSSSRKKSSSKASSNGSGRSNGSASNKSGSSRSTSSGTDANKSGGASFNSPGSKKKKRPNRKKFAPRSNSGFSQ